MRVFVWRSLAIWSLCFASWMEIVESTKCTYPAPVSQHIEWDRLTGNWYHVMNSFAQGCYKLCMFREVEDGAFATEIGLHPLGDEMVKYGRVNVHWIRMNDTQLYIVDNDHHGDEDKDHLYPSVKALWRHVMAFYTDYENYFIGLECTIEGEPLIWVQSRSLNPTDEDYRRAKAKVDSIGQGWENVHIHFVTCDQNQMENL